MWWADSHVVDRQPHGGQAAVWWTGSHVVDRQLCGEQGGFRERVRKRNVLKRNMAKFKPASEKKKEIVTPIQVCAQKGRETRFLGRKGNVISLKG